MYRSDYSILKYIKNYQPLTIDELVKKFSKTAYYRIKELHNNGYISLVPTRVALPGKPQGKDTYKITSKGENYLEHRVAEWVQEKINFILENIFTTVLAVIAAIITSIITCNIIN